MTPQKITSMHDFNKIRLTPEINDIVSFVATFFDEAVEMNASDIHIEPTREFIFTRFRIHGEFVYVSKVSHEDYAKILTRIKILANLRIDEKQRPQDGKISYFSARNREYIDIRVSILPIVFGEKIVMRILRQDTSLLNLERLELLDTNAEKIKKNLESHFGIILIAGPTGSGKTTTLFSMLRNFNPLEHNISTLEDPVEYNIPHFNQTQIRPEIDFDFAMGLRALMRQDPDIIMVGETRDRDTAILAIEAALTGHLVFSTIHTNSAAGTIQRLINMGVEPFLISSALRLVIAQRLVKKICPDCAERYRLPDGALKVRITAENPLQESIDDIDFFRPVGCVKCNQTGYIGRIGVHEVFENTPDFDHLILEKASVHDIQSRAQEHGMITLFQDAIIKAAMGKTSIEEVMKLL